MNPTKAVSPVMLFMQLTQNLQVGVGEAVKASRLDVALSQVFSGAPLICRREASGPVRECLLFAPTYGPDALPLGTLWLERTSPAQPGAIAYTFGFGGPDVPQTGTCHPSVSHRFELLGLHRDAAGAARLEVPTDRLSAAQMPLRYRLYLMDKALGSPRLSLSLPCDPSRLQ